VVLSGLKFQVSEGSRTGRITSLTTSGLFCKTIDGTFMIGANGAEERFTVEDDAVMHRLVDIAVKGMTVTITWSREFYLNPCRAGFLSQYFLTGSEGDENEAESDKPQLLPPATPQNEVRM